MWLGEMTQRCQGANPSRLSAPRLLFPEKGTHFNLPTRFATCIATESRGKNFCSQNISCLAHHLNPGVCEE